MSKTVKGSPVPLRAADPTPLFGIKSDEGYVVKSMTPMQRQRYEDGSLHSMDRLTALSPRGIELYLSGDKIDKSGPARSSSPARLDVAAVLKSFMEAEDDVDDIKKKK
jgi:hypothetical protein